LIDPLLAKITLLRMLEVFSNSITPRGATEEPTEIYTSLKIFKLAHLLSIIMNSSKNMCLISNSS